MPKVWVKSFATSLILNLSIALLSFCLTTKTHLHPIVFFPIRKMVSFYVSFFINALISSTIVVFRFGSPKASFQSCGIDVENKKDTNALCEGDESYKIKLDIRYLVQFWTPFPGYKKDH
jgi:hypothetical protein